MEGEQQHQGDNSEDQIVSKEFFSSEELNPSSTDIPPTSSEGSLTWMANEFVAHHKSAKWYTLLSLGVLVVAAGIYLLTKDKITTVVIVVAGILLGVGAAKKPREIEYRLDNEGLHFSNKDYPYALFRSFAVVHQGANSSIVLLPLKRFSLLTQALYDPKDEDKIVALVSSYLPLDENRRDILDEIMWRIHY